MATDKPQIKQKIEGASNAMKDFRKEIQELRGKLLQLDESSEDYAKTLSELANKQFELREMNENVRYSVTDLGEQFKTITRIGTGVAAGFNTIQATMALFGTESEALEKTMVKLQAGIAIVQGLEGLEGLGKTLGQAKIQFKGLIPSVNKFIASLNGVKAALVGTGIGAFIVALGLLIANWDKVTDAVQRFIQKTDNATNSIENIITAQSKLTGEIKNTNAELDREIKLMQAQGATEEEIAKKRLENADANYKKQSELVDKLQSQYNEASFWNEQGNSTWSDEKLAELEKQLNEAKNLETSYYDTLKNSQTDYEIAQIKARKEEEKADQDANNKRIESAKATAAKLAQEKEAEAEKIKDIQDRINKSNLSDSDAELYDLKKQFEEEKTLYEKHGIDTAELVNYYEREKKRIRDEYQNEILDNFNTEYEAWQSKITTAISTIDEVLNTNKSNLSSETDNYESGNITADEAYNNQLAINEAILQADREAYSAKKAFLEEQLNDENLTAEREYEIKQMLAENEIALDNAILENSKANAAAEEKLDKRKVDIKKGVLSSTASILNSMSQLVGENTKAGKAMAVSSALIQTYQSAAGAFNSAVNPPAFGPASVAMGAIFAATAVAQGLAQVKSILSVNENGSTSVPSGSGITSTPNIASSIMPTEIYGSQLSDMTEIDLQEANKDTRVYVLEKDITETQNAVKTQVEESHF